MKLGCETALSHDEHSAAHPKQARGAICYPLLGIIRRDAAHYATYWVSRRARGQPSRVNLQPTDPMDKYFGSKS